MQKATIEDGSYLVVRQHQRLHALAHPCAHLGGPLSEGTLKDGSVVCPWHGSEFDLEDGSVLDIMTGDFYHSVQYPNVDRTNGGMPR